jgi:Yip1 domain
MAAAPVLPASPAPTPQPAPLSEGARIVDTFIAPSKTFTDLKRSAAWWAPFLLLVIISTAFIYTVGLKIGFRKVTENQLQMAPKQSAQLDNLPADQREHQMQQRTTGTMYVSYFFPILTLIFWLIITTALFATFKLGAGADITFGTSFAIVVYAALPLMVKTLLACLSVLAGMNADSFSFQNPVASNPGYFLNPANGVFLYSVATNIDIFMIWTLVLTAIGFTCVTKVKSGASYAIVFGWWAFFTLLGAGVGAAFS